MKIAVTGAFSYSGKYIAQRMLERGDRVITLTGHPRRGDPFLGRVEAFPLQFEDRHALRQALDGVQVLVNTYWIRFDRGSNTQSRAVENTRVLVEAAKEAGVKRLIHISITNPSSQSRLKYFSGKAANEQAVAQSGIAYAILRPTILFGTEDILINNMAYLLRRFPFFLLPGDGTYQVQPVFVEDLADLVTDAVYGSETYVADAVGPEIFAFGDLVRLIGETVGRTPSILSVPPWIALKSAQLLGGFMGDVLLTPQELDGLMANLLISEEPPRCQTRLSDWLRDHRATIGVRYASELDRHYRD